MLAAEVRVLNSLSLRHLEQMSEEFGVADLGIDGI